MNNYVYECDINDLRYARNRIAIYKETLSQEQLLELFDDIENYIDSHYDQYALDTSYNDGFKYCTERKDLLIDLVSDAISEETNIKALKERLKPLIQSLIELGSEYL